MPWTESAYSWLVHSALASLVVLLIGSGAVLFCRQPTRRLRIIALTLAGCLVTPCLGLIPGYPHLQLGWLHAAIGEVSRSAPTRPGAVPTTSANGAFRADRPVEADRMVEAERPVEPVVPRVDGIAPVLPALPQPLPALATEPIGETAQPAPSVFNAASWVVTGYLSGVGLLLAWFLTGVAGLARIIGTAKPAPLRCRLLLAEISGRRADRVRLLAGARVRQPLACAWGRPIIVLPEDLCSDEQSLRWSLAHEWTHIERRHFAVWLLAGVARVAFFYQPLVWWLRGQLRLCQDFLADAQAARQSPEPEDYAEFLTGLARTRSLRPALVGLGMGFRRSDLYRRVLMLVRGKPLESRAPRLWSVIVTAAALVLIVAVPTITAGPRASEPQESAASETAVLGNGEPRPLAAPGAGSEKTEPKTKKTAEVEPSQSPVDVPIPKDTQGPFAMNMCLSPDGKRIAVAGRITDRHALWDPTDDFFYDQLRYPYAGPLRKAFETKIYVASCPPRLSDYSLLVENHRMSAVLAMAISPKEPYQLAYVSREMRFEFPSDPKKEIPIPRVFYPKPERSRGVLYVVPLSGGAPKAVLTFDDDVAGFPRLYYRLYVTSSLCWNDDASALFYGDRVSVSRISLSGKRDVLYRFDQTQDEQSVHYHCLASKLACRSGGLVEFLDYGGDMDRNGKAWNKVLSVLSMRLVRVAQDGKVVEKRQWPQFPFFNPPLRERS